MNNMKYCNTCLYNFNSAYYNKHLQTKKHKDNIKQTIINDIKINDIKTNELNGLNNIEIIEKIKEDWTYIKYISKDKFNNELINMLLSISGNYVKFIPNDILTINNIMIAIENDENCIRYLPFELINKYEIALSCVNRNGNLLNYFNEYNNDYNLCKTAILNKGLSWFYISETLKENEELLLLAIEKNNNILLLLNQNKGLFEKYKNIIEEKIDKYDYSLFSIKKGECIICMDTKDIVILLCFDTHNICKSCFQHINKCPLCRKDIKKNEINNSIKIKIWS